MAAVAVVAVAVAAAIDQLGQRTPEEEGDRSARARIEEDREGKTGFRSSTEVHLDQNQVPAGGTIPRALGMEENCGETGQGHQDRPTHQVEA